MRTRKRKVLCRECESPMGKLAHCKTCGSDLNGKEPRRDPIRSRKKRGVEVQTWGVDANNQLVTAGVYFIRSICAKEIVAVFRHWKRWRNWYRYLPRQRRSGYADKPQPQCAFYGARPIDGDPKELVWVNVSAF